MLPEQGSLQWLAADVTGRRGHVDHLAGCPDRKHTPERNIFPGRAKGNFPSVRFDNIHDDGRDQHDEERNRPKLRRRIVDVPRTDMPHDETEGKQTDDE